MAIINLIFWKWRWRWLANVTWHLTCVWAIKGSGRNTKGTRITMNVLQYGRIRNWIVSIIPISVSKTNPKIRSIISLFIIGSPFFQQGFIILNWTNEPNINFESNKVKWKKTSWNSENNGRSESFVHFRSIQRFEKSITFSTKWCSPLTSTAKRRLTIRTCIYLALCRPFLH